MKSYSVQKLRLLISSSLQVNLSLLDNRNDVITCRGLQPMIRSSIHVSYIPIGIIVYYDDYAVALCQPFVKSCKGVQNLCE